MPYKELSSLEVEPLEVHIQAHESEQDNSLDTITTAQSEVDVAALLTGKGVLPVMASCCCFCCCTVCCCAC
jgi:hypothetical protein